MLLQAFSDAAVAPDKDGFFAFFFGGGAAGGGAAGRGADRRWHRGPAAARAPRWPRAAVRAQNMCSPEVASALLQAFPDAAGEGQGRRPRAALRDQARDLLGGRRRRAAGVPPPPRRRTRTPLALHYAINPLAGRGRRRARCRRSPTLTKLVRGATAAGRAREKPAPPRAAGCSKAGHMNICMGPDVGRLRHGAESSSRWTGTVAAADPYSSRQKSSSPSHIAATRGSLLREGARRRLHGGPNKISRTSSETRRARLPKRMGQQPDLALSSAADDNLVLAASSVAADGSVAIVSEADAADLFFLDLSEAAGSRLIVPMSCDDAPLLGGASAWTWMTATSSAATRRCAARRRGCSPAPSTRPPPRKLRRPDDDAPPLLLAPPPLDGAAAVRPSPPLLLGLVLLLCVGSAWWCSRHRRARPARRAADGARGRGARPRLARHRRARRPPRPPARRGEARARVAPRARRARGARPRRVRRPPQRPPLLSCASSSEPFVYLALERAAMTLLNGPSSPLARAAAATVALSTAARRGRRRARAASRRTWRAASRTSTATASAARPQAVERADRRRRRCEARRLWARERRRRRRPRRRGRLVELDRLACARPGLARLGGARAAKAAAPPGRRHRRRRRRDAADAAERRGASRGGRLRPRLRRPPRAHRAPPLPRRPPRGRA